jgi:hypothetical protein
MFTSRLIRCSGGGGLCLPSRVSSLKDAPTPTLRIIFLGLDQLDPLVNNDLTSDHAGVGLKHRRYGL